MLRWLIIGIGDITTKRVLPAILFEPESKLVGIVTRDPRKAEPYNVPSWITIEDALDQSQCDAVAPRIGNRFGNGRRRQGRRSAGIYLAQGDAAALARRRDGDIFCRQLGRRYFRCCGG